MCGEHRHCKQIMTVVAIRDVCLLSQEKKGPTLLVVVSMP